MTQTAKDLTQRKAELEAALRAPVEPNEEAEELRNEIMKHRLVSHRDTPEILALEAKRREVTKDRDEKRRAIKTELRGVTATLAEHFRKTLRAEFVEMSDEAVAAHQADLRAQIANLTEHAEAAQAELDARTARKKISALSPAEREALLEGEAEFQALKLQLEADKKARS